MSKTEELIGDALAGIEMVRPGVAILGTFDPQAALIAGAALTMLYEGLVTIRAAEAHANPAELQTAIRGQIQKVIQELAAAKFGAMPSQGD
jgi:type VI protein secretion system component VasF